MPYRRKFDRRQQKGDLRKIFVLSCEGTITEPQYFRSFNKQNPNVRVICLPSKHGRSPPEVLNRMKKGLQERFLRKSDEAWLVVDMDWWTDGQLSELYQWSRQKKNYGFALSNPKFELWLLMHFEDVRGAINSRVCSKKLQRHLPNFKKHINPKNISTLMIANAIERAKRQDNPPCSDWPRTTGTTVYRLVERIL